MSSFFDVPDANRDLDSLPVSWFLPLAEGHPILAEALIGKAKADQEGPARDPMTLMIFERDGKLKFRLGSPLGKRAFFGVIREPAQGLDSIEASLAAQDGEWVVSKGK